MLGNGLILAEGGEAVDAQVPLQGGEIVVEQGPEYGKILLGEVVDRTRLLPGPLGDETERVLIGHQQEGQIVLPQVFVKAVVGGQVQQPLHLAV